MTKKSYLIVTAATTPPEEIVKGALDALDNDSDLSLVLTGKEDVLKNACHEKFRPHRNHRRARRRYERRRTHRRNPQKPKAVW
ncbi:MAG: hypothetical protein L6V85_06815 [Clostridiales bacterium]|nr:MAG: hypothetical protein L6V85_06815 [Clostridiales bacterium]